MKKTLALLLIAISLGSCNQSQTDVVKTTAAKEEPKQYRAKRDSIIKETEYGSIYVTKDTSVVMYSWLANENIDTTVFNELYSANNISELLATNKIKMKHYRNIPILGNWNLLYVLKNHFYVYSPSDWMYNKRILVSDSALYHMSSGDWSFELIQNVETMSNGDLNINLVGYDNERIELSIRFIDDSKNIALWHRKSKEDEYSELRVRSSLVRKFEMIVNDCLEMKCYQEFVFETPGYSEIIQTYGNTK
jgi:hypothetical protein